MAKPEEEYKKEAYAAAVDKAKANATTQGTGGFSYDVNADPLYQQYKDQYIQNGKLAMQDTMGKAAALTGGYGSTYSQQVGQQAYDSYLQNLNAMIPELYSQAYSKYMDDYNMKQQEYSKLYNLIATTGYNPTDAELAAAGLTRAQAQAIIAARTPVASGGYYGGPGRSNDDEDKDDDDDSPTGTNPTGGRPTRGQAHRANVAAYRNGEISYEEYVDLERALH